RQWTSKAIGSPRPGRNRFFFAACFRRLKISDLRLAASQVSLNRTLKEAVTRAGITLTDGLPTSMDVISRLVGGKSDVPSSNGDRSKASKSEISPGTGLLAR